MIAVDGYFDGCNCDVHDAEAMDVRVAEAMDVRVAEAMDVRDTRWEYSMSRRRAR